MGTGANIIAFNQNKTRFVQGPTRMDPNPDFCQRRNTTDRCTTSGIRRSPSRPCPRTGRGYPLSCTHNTCWHINACQHANTTCQRIVLHACGRKPHDNSLAMGIAGSAPRKLIFVVRKEHAVVGGPGAVQ